MKSIRVGIDVDGVAANFVLAWQKLALDKVGRMLIIPPGGPQVWHWDRAAGLTAVESKQLWTFVEASTTWWSELKPLPTAPYAFDKLGLFVRSGDVELYFITSRPGRAVKLQTEKWLQRWGVEFPTVLVAKDAGHKAEFAVDIALDYFIDDKPENIVAVKGALDKKVKTFVADAGYNASFEGADFRVAHIGHFADIIVTEVIKRNAPRRGKKNDSAG